MTLYEFNTLSENEKANAVWSAIFLMSRENDALKYSLYSVNDFFVEVSYDNIENKIIKFQSFRTKRLLEAYLAVINFEQF